MADFFNKSVIYENIKKAWTEELQKRISLPNDIARTYKYWVQGLIKQSGQQQANIQQSQGAQQQQAQGE